MRISSVQTSGACERGHWTAGEDGKLRRIVEKYGPRNWNSIAENLPGRSGTDVVTCVLYIYRVCKY